VTARREWIDALAGIGEPVELDGESAATFARPGRAWMVAEGALEVDLELVGVRGTRTRVARVGAGGLLPGLPEASELPGDVRLVVSGEARLLEAPLERLLAELAEPALRAEGGEVLRGWLDALARDSGVEPRPASAQVDLAAGEERTLLFDDTAAPREGVVWASVGEGVFRLLGRNELLAGSRGLVPLTAGLWGAVATPEVRLRVFSEEAPPAPEEIAASLRAVLRGVVAIVAAAARRRLDADRARLAARSDLDGRVLDGALRRLSDVTAGAAPGEIPVGSLVDGPLLAACRLVGESLGLGFRAPTGGLPEDAGAGWVARVARASKVRQRAVSLRGEWWRRDNGPLLAFREEDGRPVALRLTSSSSYALVDPTRPEAGETRIDAATAATLRRTAYMFYPSFGDRALKLVDLFRVGIRGLGVDVRLLLGASLAVSLAGLVAPVSTQILFDEIIPRADRGLLPVMAMFLVAVPLASALVSVVKSRAMLRIEGKMEMNAEAALMDRVLRLPARFFQGFLAGDLETRLMAVTNVRQALSSTVLNAILTGLFSFTSLGVMLAYDSKLALLGFVLGTVSVGAVFASSLVGLRFNRRTMKLEGEIQGLVLQLFSGIAKLRVAAAERRAFAVWAHRFARRERLRYRFGAISNHFQLFNSTFPLFTSMALFFVVVQLGGTGSGAAAGAAGAAGAAAGPAATGAAAGGITSGSFVAALAAFQQFLAGLLGLGTTLISVIGIVPELERVRPLLEAVPEDNEEQADPGRLRGEIEITGLVFRYGEDSPVVLNEVSLHVKSGEMVAIVGPSGSGKSTLARLLLGLETPQAGTIYYDGEDLESLDPGAVRNQIGTVLQGGIDLGGTIEQAILGGETDLAIEDAWEATRLAAIEEEIRALPMGMTTVLSENWTTFSGGQQQRLRLARALVRKPPILILDEATSAVDNRAQEQIRANLDALGTTRIVIAHRLSTIRQADRIYVLEAGRITESGTFDDLMERGGRFAALAGRQQL